MYDWLKTLKVGDWVLVNGSIGAALTKARVSELTKSGNFRVGTKLYRKEDGSERGGSFYYASYIHEYNEERWQQELDRRKKTAHVHNLSSIRWNDLPTVTLEAIVAIIEADKASQEAEKVLDKYQK
jgi:hypothetical protein